MWTTVGPAKRGRHHRKQEHHLFNAAEAIETPEQWRESRAEPQQQTTILDHEHATNIDMRPASPHESGYATGEDSTSSTPTTQCTSPDLEALPPLPLSKAAAKKQRQRARKAEVKARADDIEKVLADAKAERDAAAPVVVLEQRLPAAQQAKSKVKPKALSTRAKISANPCPAAYEPQSTLHTSPDAVKAAAAARSRALQMHPQSMIERGLLTREYVASCPAPHVLAVFGRLPQQVQNDTRRMMEEWLRRRHEAEFVPHRDVECVFKMLQMLEGQGLAGSPERIVRAMKRVEFPAFG